MNLKLGLIIIQVPLVYKFYNLVPKVQLSVSRSLRYIFQQMDPSVYLPLLN